MWAPPDSTCLPLVTRCPCYTTALDLSREDNYVLSLPMSPSHESPNVGVVLGTPTHTLKVFKDLNLYQNGINSTAMSSKRFT